MPAKAKPKAKSKGAPRNSLRGAASSSTSVVSPKRKPKSSSPAITALSIDSVDGHPCASASFPVVETADGAIMAPQGPVDERISRAEDAEEWCEQIEEKDAEEKRMIVSKATDPCDSAAGTVEEPFASEFEQLSNIPDPWLELSDDDAMQRIQDELWSVFELASVDNDGDRGGLHAREVGGFNAVHIDAKSAEHIGLRSCGQFVSVAVSLDLSSNLLEHLYAFPPMWLRNLSLANNPLRSLDGLAQLFPKLLSLDLSFVDFLTLIDPWDALAVCLYLRSLDLEGSCITHLGGMQPLLSLLILNLVDNELEELDALSVLGSCCPQLQHLDLRENSISQEIGYREAVARHLPHLVEHDNQSQRKYIPKPREAHCRIDQGGPRVVHAVDGLLLNEHCSCLEGNPCTDSSTCLDWPNREKVASHVRESFHLPQGQWSMGFNFRACP